MYDTPYSARNRFRDLLQASAPLVVVFMANFGHPITRTFASRYADTYAALHDGGFALVVRSRADKLSRSTGRTHCPIPCSVMQRACCMSISPYPQAKAR